MGSLIKAIPFIGQTTSAITMPIVAGAATYAVGKVFQRHFASGGTVSDFDPKKSKGFFKEKYEEGKAIAAEHLNNDKSAKSKEAEKKKDEPKAKKEEPEIKTQKTEQKKDEPKAKKDGPEIKTEETKKDTKGTQGDKPKP